MPLVDRATNTLALLDTESLGERPLVFVAHSLGGLLVKQMLRHGRDIGEPRWRTIVGNTRGVVFVSTPHSGSDVADWVSLLGSVLRKTTLVDELKAHDPRLRELNLWFRNNLRGLDIRSEVYCEERPTNGCVVVNKTSADPGIEGVVPIPLDEDHITVCKPPSRDAIV
jgi:pimeloyl-ACP methyl ester carboxylesterase